MWPRGVARPSSAFCQADSANFGGLFLQDFTIFPAQFYCIFLLICYPYLQIGLVFPSLTPLRL
jgi:hypothetical protein